MNGRMYNKFCFQFYYIFTSKFELLESKPSDIRIPMHNGRKFNSVERNMKLSQKAAESMDAIESNSC